MPSREEMLKKHSEKYKEVRDRTNSYTRDDLNKAREKSKERFEKSKEGWSDNKKKLYDKTEDGKKLGEFTEAPGGGTPKMDGGGRGSMGGKFIIASDSEEAEQIRDEHKGEDVIVRVNQPRDEDGKFTYNSANAKERKVKYHGKGTVDEYGKHTGDHAPFPVKFTEDFFKMFHRGTTAYTGEGNKRIIQINNLSDDEIRMGLETWDKASDSFVNGVSDEGFIERKGKETKKELEAKSEGKDVIEDDYFKKVNEKTQDKIDKVRESQRDTAEQKALVDELNKLNLDNIEDSARIDSLLKEETRRLDELNDEEKIKTKYGNFSKLDLDEARREIETNISRIKDRLAGKEVSYKNEGIDNSSDIKVDKSEQSINSVLDSEGDRIANGKGLRDTLKEDKENKAKYIDFDSYFALTPEGSNIARSEFEKQLKQWLNGDEELANKIAKSSNLRKLSEEDLNHLYTRLKNYEGFKGTKEDLINKIEEERKKIYDRADKDNFTTKVRMEKTPENLEFMEKAKENKQKAKEEAQEMFSNITEDDVEDVTEEEKQQGIVDKKEKLQRIKQKFYNTNTGIEKTPFNKSYLEKKDPELLKKHPDGISMRDYLYEGVYEKIRNYNIDKEDYENTSSTAKNIKGRVKEFYDDLKKQYNDLGLVFNEDKDFKSQTTIKNMINKLSKNMKPKDLYSFIMEENNKFNIDTSSATYNEETGEYEYSNLKRKDKRAYNKSELEKKAKGLPRDEKEHLRRLKNIDDYNTKKINKLLKNNNVYDFTQKDLDKSIKDVRDIDRGVKSNIKLSNKEFNKLRDRVASYDNQEEIKSIYNDLKATKKSERQEKFDKLPNKLKKQVKDYIDLEKEKKARANTKVSDEGYSSQYSGLDTSYEDKVLNALGLDRDIDIEEKERA